MATNINDKIFVINQTTNTQYGGVDPTGEFKKIGEIIPQPAYQVYTALLTQTGGDDPQTQESGNLVIGRTYRIIVDGPIRGDFTNVGAPDNTDDTAFVATGTIPTSWGDCKLQYNTGAPVVTVLENTIGNVWFTYSADGIYTVNCSDVIFNQNTYMIVGNPTWDGGNGFIQSGFDGNVGLIAINPDFLTGPTNCGLLINTPIEIRVYN
jgi:hypothetical protein